MNYFTNPAFSLPKTGKKTIQQLSGEDYASPGPIYNTFGLGIKHKSVSHSIGLSKRSDINHGVIQTPSPAAYNPEKNDKLTNKISFPKHERKEGITMSPGPAWYRPSNQSSKPRLLQYSMGSRYCSTMDDANKNPGPGDYESQPDTIQQSKSKSRSTDKQFGLASRFSQQKISLPAPGTYQISNKEGFITNKGTIGKGMRHGAKLMTPGPSDYHKKSFVQQGIDRKVGKTISARLNGCFQQNEITSSAYNKYFETRVGEIPEFQTSKKYSIGKQNRQFIKTNNFPGPTDYITDTYMHKQKCHAVMPKAQWNQYNDIINNPGPGTYEQSSPKGGAFTIPRSKSTAVIQDTPGVARYQLTKGIESYKRGHIFPKSNRASGIPQHEAGVGDYDIIQKSASKGTIPKAERFKQIQSTKPGPGDYYIHTTLSNLHHYQKKK